LHRDSQDELALLLLDSQRVAADNEAAPRQAQGDRTGSFPRRSAPMARVRPSSAQRIKVQRPRPAAGCSLRAPCGSIIPRSVSRAPTSASREPCPDGIGHFGWGPEFHVSGRILVCVWWSLSVVPGGGALDRLGLVVLRLAALAALAKPGITSAGNGRPVGLWPKYGCCTGHRVLVPDRGAVGMCASGAGWRSLVGPGTDPDPLPP